MAGCKARPWFGCLAAKTVRGACINHLHGLIRTPLHHMRACGHALLYHRHRVGGLFDDGFFLCPRPVFLTPAWRAALQDFHKGMPENLQCPPHAGCGKKPHPVIDHNPTVTVDAQSPHGLRKACRCWQHMGQGAAMVRDRIQIKASGMGNMALFIFLGRIAVMGGQIPRRIENNQIVCIQLAV